MKKSITVALVAALLILTLPPTVAADDVNPYGTSTVDPAGPNEIIFTISKAGKKIQYTTSRLSKLKAAQISIYEPFLKKRQTFSVIPIKTFFSAVGISANDRVNTTAINDYVYTNKASSFLAASAFIAIKRNGASIPYDQGGPLRLVFADNSRWAKNLDAWNWSLASISVK